jgi:hypothetical protein
MTYLLHVIGHNLTICFVLKALLWIFTGSSFPAAAGILQKSG